MDGHRADPSFAVKTQQLPVNQELIAVREPACCSLRPHSRAEKLEWFCQETLERTGPSNIYSSPIVSQALNYTLCTSHFKTGTSIPIVQMKITEAPRGLLSCSSSLCVQDGQLGFASDVRAQALFSPTLGELRMQDEDGSPKSTGRNGWHTRLCVCLLVLPLASQQLVGFYTNDYF